MTTFFYQRVVFDFHDCFSQCIRICGHQRGSARPLAAASSTVTGNDKQGIYSTCDTCVSRNDHFPAAIFVYVCGTYVVRMTTTRLRTQWSFMCERAVLFNQAMMVTPQQAWFCSSQKACENSRAEEGTRASWTSALDVSKSWQPAQS